MQKGKPNLLYTGQGTPVVMLHSSMSSKIQWYGFMQAMKNGYLMIAPDLYGCGDSPFPEEREHFSLSHEVSMVESLIEDVVPEGEPFHLVGHSYGGAAALRFCYKYKDTNRIRSLSLFEPVAFHLLPEDDEALEDVFRLQKFIGDELERGRKDKAAEFFVDYWSVKGTYAGYHDSIKEMFETAVKKLPLDLKALIEEPLSLEDYKAIRTPVCLMAGAKSPLHSRRVSELLVNTLPHCRMHWLDTGHMAPVNQAGEVNAIMESFIRGGYTSLARQ
jgi:pimeloyl-ACP methyl ester carboxylesterase